MLFIYRIPNHFLRMREKLFSQQKLVFNNTLPLYQTGLTPVFI